MKPLKLKLEIESLDIQSFSTAGKDREEQRGTVQAHDDSYECITYGYDCTWYPEMMCYSNPIAFPTEPNCDGNCGLTYTCE